MSSLFYSVELISEKIVEQELDDYEFDLGFTPEFVSVKDAIEINQTLLPDLSGEMKRWTERDTLVLKEIQKLGKYWLDLM